MALTLREGRPADLAACSRIFALAQPLAYPRRGGATPEPLDFEAASREEALWVAEEGGRVLGLVTIYLPGCFIHHLYIAPAHHRSGLGRALLALALRQCGGHADLKCDEANRAAQAFYLAQGWRPAGWGWAPSGPWLRYRY